MDEAIELELEGRNPYPKRAMFLDADEPGLGEAIGEAADEGLAVVLCYTDDTRRIPRDPDAGRRDRLSRRTPLVRAGRLRSSAA
jgi:hypothetical protein